MKVALRIALGALGALIGVVVATLVGARFADGPLAIVAGGPFRSGVLVEGEEPDWSFVRDVPEVEIQLLEPARSRTTWILEHDGRIFVPCGYMDSTWGRLWKRWPVEAERDGRAILRVGGKLYERELVRVRDPALFTALTAELVRKYPIGADLDGEAAASGALWLFEIAPREQS